MTTNSLRLLSLLILCPLSLWAQDTPPTPPVAEATTLNLFEMLLNGPEGPIFSTVTFVSQTSIVVTECPMTDKGSRCKPSSFRWEGGRLERDEQRAPDELKSSLASSDGSRRLLDFDDRKVAAWQHILEIARSVSTLGMSGPEDVNREVIQVFDTKTRRSCFEWIRGFPMTYAQPHCAAISPSGEFIAIAIQNRLTVYRLPNACEGSTVSREAE